MLGGELPTRAQIALDLVKIMAGRDKRSVESVVKDAIRITDEFLMLVNPPVVLSAYSSDSDIQSVLNLPLSDLKLSSRAMTGLVHYGGLSTIRDVATREEFRLLAIRQVGEVTINEIRSKLRARGLDIGCLAPKPEAEPQP